MFSRRGTPVVEHIPYDNYLNEELRSQLDAAISERNVKKISTLLEADEKERKKRRKASHLAHLIEAPLINQTLPNFGVPPLSAACQTVRTLPKLFVYLFIYLFILLCFLFSFFLPLFHSFLLLFFCLFSLCFLSFF